MALMDVSTARRMILERTRPLSPRTINLYRALGRVTAQEIVSEVDNPPFAKSAMDGYAVRSGDLDAGASPLRVLECIGAGDVPTCRVTAGTCVQIMTGAEIPPGADAVVPREKCHREVGSDHVKVLDVVGPGGNIIQAGQSIRQGQAVLPKGRRLGPVEVAVLAEIGCTSLVVSRAPRVAIVATGNELVPPEHPIGPGQIRNSNSSLLRGLTREHGGRPMDLGIVRDQPQDMIAVISRALESDVVLLSGGVSMGDFDLVPTVLGELGVERVLHGVDLRPGKPLWFGIFEPTVADGNGDRRVLVFGLPGNPVSGLVCFHLFVRPALARLGGLNTDDQLPLGEGRLAVEFSSRSGRPTFWPGRLLLPGGGPQIEPLDWKGSFDLRGLVDANCLLTLPAGEHSWESGQSIPYFDLGQWP
jgi:molybdopterin molybdotransferase